MNLLETIKQQTAETLKLHIENIEAGAKQEFDYMINYQNAYVEYLKEKRINKQAAFKYGCTSEAEKTAHKYKNMTYFGFDKFLQNEKTKAVQNYETATQKAAFKIQQKLNVQNIKIQTSEISFGNIDMTFTDGTKKVTCQTIIAEGMIQKKHFRYLVK